MTTIIISLLSFLTLIFLLVVIGFLVKTNNKLITDIANKKIETQQPIQKQEVPPNSQALAASKDFQFGVDNALILTQIVLYKLYCENSILDYDSISEAMTNTIRELLKDPLTLRDWNDKFTIYMSTKINEEKQEGEVF
jgi:hypothetical protein